MVTSRMAACLLLIVLVMATVLPADCSNCSPGYTRCSSSSACIRLGSLCDGSRDCPVRGEDEDTVWCSMYSRYDNICGRGNTLCSRVNTCHAWATACTQRCSSPFIPSPEVCTAIANGLPPGKEEGPDAIPAPQIDIKELVSFMAVANCSLEKTSALKNQTSGCPQLYIPIGNTCIAPLPFVLTWPEALVACRSISGKLLEVEFVETFAEVVQFLIKADFSADFWTGGFYDIEKEDWAWSSGPKMPRYTPYWAVKHNSTCATRQSPTLGALPGCFHYQQAPTSQGAGFCAALQFEYMYYISDEGCFQKKQPLCIHL